MPLAANPVQPHRVAGVVLAAGASSRLGTPKQLLPLAGRPALAHTLDAVRKTSLSPLVLVLGFRAEDIECAVNTAGFAVVRNDDYALGQSTSVQAALRALPDDVRAAIFLLGDQPEVEPTVVEALLRRYGDTNAPLVQPRYAEGRGNPVLVSRELFPELLALSGDTGARPLLERHAKQIALVDVPAHHRPGDIDTWGDYENLRRHFEPVPNRDDL